MLFAGVSNRIITPDFPTLLAGYPLPMDRYHDEVHDDLQAHCFYLKNKNEEFAIITIDLLSYTKRRVEMLREQIREACGIPCENIILSATHTHSGPCTASVPFIISDARKEMYPYYLDKVNGLIIEGVKEAKETAFAAKIGVDKGHCSKEQGVGGNRRHKDGVTDPDVWVVAIKDMDNCLRGAIVNYALHPTFLHAENKQISADYPGYIYEFLRNKYINAVIGFQNGASGNQSSRHFRTGQNFDEAKRVGYAIAAEAERVISEMEFVDDPVLFSKYTEVYPEMKQIPNLEKAIADQKCALQEFKKSQREGQAYGVQRTLECTLIGADRMLKIAQAGKKAMDGFMTCSPFEIHVLGICNARMVTVPCEIFVEYALRLKKESPFEKTFLASVANGYGAGYICTQEAHNEGGYEALGTIYTGHAGDILIDSALSLLNENV